MTYVRLVAAVFAVLALILGAAVVTALHTSLMTGPDTTGTVTDTDRNGKRRYVTVTGPDGAEHRARVRLSIYRACQTGDPWPACKED